MKPQFFVIAGPNGAGKSTYAHLHLSLGTHIFNGDLVFAELLKRYPNYDPQKLMGGVPMQMEKDVEYAISNNLDFGFETNYANRMPVELTKSFRDEGYETNLLYFGLERVSDAALRVDTRVSLGGHDVDTETIRSNMENGIVNVIKNLKLYDEIRFADTSVNGAAPIIANYKKIGNELILFNNKVNWYNWGFKKAMSKLQLGRIEIKEQTNYLGVKRNKGNELDGGLGL